MFATIEDLRAARVEHADLGDLIGWPELAGVRGWTYSTDDSVYFIAQSGQRFSCVVSNRDTVCDTLDAAEDWLWKQMDRPSLTDLLKSPRKNAGSLIGATIVYRVAAHSTDIRTGTVQQLSHSEDWTPKHVERWTVRVMPKGRGYRFADHITLELIDKVKELKC